MTKSLFETFNIIAEKFRPTKGGLLLNGSSVTVNLSRCPMRFYRHGWQSWSLATWLDPAISPVPVSSPEFRAKDEDLPYAFSRNHVSAWVCAVELENSEILLLGALGLGGRIELDGTTLRGFYETGSGDWFLSKGREDDIFSQYANLLSELYGKTRRTIVPRVWCSWYSLYKWISEPVILDALAGLDDLPFDVFQLDDGWQIARGDLRQIANSPQE